VIHEKCGSTFVILTLEKRVRYLEFLHRCKQKEHFIHLWKTCSPHLNNVLTLPWENETSHFIRLQCTLRVLHTASSVVRNTNFINYRVNKLTVTRYVQNVHQWHEHKHTSVLAIGQLCHQSVSDCSKPRHTCSRRCRSSSMSRTWQWRHIYVRCKINKYLQRVSISISRCVKIIKTHQDFPELRPQIYCHVFSWITV